MNGYFLDLNSTIKDKAASEIAHVLLTPKRSRIRKPDFGTDLIKYIFEPNDDLTWDRVKEEASESVRKYVPNVEIEEMEVVVPEESPHDIFLDIIYTVAIRNKVENNRLAIKLT